MNMLSPDQCLHKPENGIDHQMMVSYRAAIHAMLDDQVTRGVNTNKAADIFDTNVKSIMHMVSGRKPRQNRKNYVEKIDCFSSPLDTAQYVSALEDYFWTKGVDCKNNKVLFASLRNRYIYLYTEKGIIRGESVFKAELSDFFGIVAQRKNIDPHPFYCDVMQIETGKTNKGIKLFGRVRRHKNPLLCPIGAKGFYLMYRFHVTNEFACPPDFHDNASWYSMKLLIEATTKNSMNSVTNSSYAKEIKKGCKEVGCYSNHAVHIGRTQGSMEAELDGDNSKDLQRLGNWDPRI